MYDFNYQRADSVADASAKVKASDDGMLMAGGMTLIPTLKQRLAQPADVVDLGGISDLAGISVDGDTVTIGAMTTHATVAASADVKSKIPALADLADGIGDPQVRNRGTIGGSIANNDPAADYPSACVGLGATIVTDQREITADDFFVGMFETALEEGEVVTAVKFPVPDKAAYMKFPNPASRYAIVGVFVSEGAVVVGCRDRCRSRWCFPCRRDGECLSSGFNADAVAGIAVSADDLNSDIHASSEYRAHLVTVMAKRAVLKAG